MEVATPPPGTPDGRQEEFRLLAVTGLLALLAGVLTDHLLPCLLLGLVAYLAWHLIHLAYLRAMLAGRSPTGRLLAYGLWKPVFLDFQKLHSDIRQRDRRLSRIQTHFRDALSALPEAVVILDRQENIDWVNPAAGRLLGIDSDTATGRAFREAVRDPVLEEYLSAREFDQPLVFSPPGNRAIVVSMTVTALPGHRQHLIFAVDITRQYHVDSTRRDFVANISHELRTPLTVIAGLLEQMQEEADPANRRAVELMQRQAGRMSALISDLLTLSRLELDEQPLTRETIDMSEFLGAVADDARTLGKPTGHAVRLDIDSGDGLTGNRNELRTAMSSLVTNAVQHTPQRTQIRIHWYTDAEGGHIEVSDTGEGIAARHLPRLTERLYRVDAGRARATGGTGLGLAIVKHVLDRHEAELEISSTPGHGSTFRCNFPAESVVLTEPGQARGIGNQD